MGDRGGAGRRPLVHHGPTQAATRSGGSRPRARSAPTGKRGHQRPARDRGGPDGALWFTNRDGDSIGRITTGGVITTFRHTSIRGPREIAAGPDGALWFTTSGLDRADHDPRRGQQLQARGIRGPRGIAAGPDGALWFTNYQGGSIGRITTGGTVTSFGHPSIQGPRGITAGPDGALWFTNFQAARSGGSPPAGRSATSPDPGINGPAGITRSPPGRTAPSGSPTRRRLDRADQHRRHHQPLPTKRGIDGATRITAGPDGGLWFTDGLGSSIGGSRPTATVTTYRLRQHSAPWGIAAGRDGAWFTHNNANSIGRVRIVGGG